jgi:anti-anti-sigma factor
LNEPTGIQIVRLGGELEIGRKRELRDAFELSPDARAVLVDLSEVTYADSTALTELLRFCVMAQRAGRPIAIVIRTRQFSRLVQYAGLAGAFKVFETYDDALTFLQEQLAI